MSRSRLEKAIAERVRNIQIEKLTVSFKVGDRASLGAVVDHQVIKKIAEEAAAAVETQAVYDKLRNTEKQKK